MSSDDGRPSSPEDKPLPLAMRREGGAEPWPGYHDDPEMQFALVDSIVGKTGQSIGNAGELADLLAALPRDMSVHLDPVEWAAGPAPWGTATIIARRIMLTERHPEPAGDASPEGWEGWVPGIELQTVFLAEDLPDDHVPDKDEIRPAGTYDQAADALDHNRLNDALRGVAGVLNALSERIENEVAGLASGEDRTGFWR
ncbi:hypothetical protein [Streptosporangium sp. NPDC002607]